MTSSDVYWGFSPIPTPLVSVGLKILVPNMLPIPKFKVSAEYRITLCKIYAEFLCSESGRAVIV